MPELRFFDDTPIPKDNAKKKKKKRQLGATCASNQTQEEEKIQITDEVTLDLEISVFGGVKGVEITEENCKVENFEDYSDRYWIKCHFLDGVEIVSEKRKWASEFQVEEEVGRCDFSIKVRKELKANSELRDQIMGNVWISIWQEKPILKKIKAEEEGEEDREECQLGEDGIPLMKVSQIGWVKVQTD